MQKACTFSHASIQAVRRRSLAESHPEWFARDRVGNFCPVNDFYVTCPNAGYYGERMAEVVREMLTRYDVDGIWNNQGKFAAWDTDGCYLRDVP